MSDAYFDMKKRKWIISTKTKFENPNNTFGVTGGNIIITESSFEDGLRSCFTLFKAAIEENPKRFLTHEEEWVRKYARKLIEEENE